MSPRFLGQSQQDRNAGFMPLTQKRHFSGKTQKIFAHSGESE